MSYNIPKQLHGINASIRIQLSNGANKQILSLHDWHAKMKTFYGYGMEEYEVPIVDLFALLSLKVQFFGGTFYHILTLILHHLLIVRVTSMFDEGIWWFSRSVQELTKLFSRKRLINKSCNSIN